MIETVLSAYGLKLEQEDLDAINNSFYAHKNNNPEQHMSANHKSLAVKMVGPDLFTPVKYAPIFIADPLDIGNLSPLKVEKGEDGLYHCHFQCGSASWIQTVHFPKPPQYATTVFSVDDDSYLGKNYADACVATDNGGLILIDAGYGCEHNCSFCIFDKEAISPNPNKSKQLKQVLQYIAASTGKITACLSAGSKKSADRGIPDLIGPMLAVIDELVTEYPQLKVALELELMPWQTTADEAIFKLLEKFYQKGYVKAVNLNPETPIGTQRGYFMDSGEFGKANIPVIGINGYDRGYLETFQLLKHHFPNIQMAGLILYGLKPPNESWDYHSQCCLETVAQFAQYGIKLCLQPLKLSVKSSLSYYPIVDPYWLTGTVLYAGAVHMQHGLHHLPRIGCVNGCDACDSSRSSYSLLKAYQIQGNDAVHGLLGPWQEWLRKYL